MAEKNNSDLFYTCSLLEFIGRKQKLPRVSVADIWEKRQWTEYTITPTFSTVNPLRR